MLLGSWLGHAACVSATSSCGAWLASSCCRHCTTSGEQQPPCSDTPRPHAHAARCAWRAATAAAAPSRWTLPARWSTAAASRRPHQPPLWRPCRTSWARWGWRAEGQALLCLLRRGWRVPPIVPAQLPPAYPFSSQPKHCPSSNVLCPRLRPALLAVYLFFSFSPVPSPGTLPAACSCARLFSTPRPSQHAQRMLALCLPTHVAAIELLDACALSPPWPPPEPNPPAPEKHCLQNLFACRYSPSPGLPPRCAGAHALGLYTKAFRSLSHLIVPPRILPEVPRPSAAVPASPGRSSPCTHLRLGVRCRQARARLSPYLLTYPPALPDSAECSLPSSVMCQSGRVQVQTKEVSGAGTGGRCHFFAVLDTGPLWVA